MIFSFVLKRLRVCLYLQLFVAALLLHWFSSSRWRISSTCCWSVGFSANETIESLLLFSLFWADHLVCVPGCRPSCQLKRRRSRSRYRASWHWRVVPPRSRLKLVVRETYDGDVLQRMMWCLTLLWFTLEIQRMGKCLTSLVRKERVHIKTIRHWSHAANTEVHRRLCNIHIWTLCIYREKW